MNGFARIVVVGMCGVTIGCVPQKPQRKLTIEAPKLSCEDANRLAYRTVTTLGYTITSLQVAREGQPGTMVVTKEGGQDGSVAITCSADGAVVEPERSGTCRSRRSLARLNDRMISRISFGIRLTFYALVRSMRLSKDREKG